MDKNTIYEREFSFLDKNRNKAEIEVEITNRNGYPEFTASCSFKNGSGQAFHDIVPASKLQKKFLDLHKEWHLNGMNAGTKKQSDFLDNWFKKNNEHHDYTKACEVLKKVRPDGIEFTALEVMQMEKEAFKLNIQNEDAERLIKEFEEKFAKTSEHKWLIFNFKQVEFDHKCIMDIEEGKQRAYFNSIYEKKAFGDNFRHHLEKRFRPLKQSIQDLALKTLLYDIDPADGKPFKYGSKWLKKTLPDTFQENLDKLINDIEAENDSEVSLAPLCDEFEEDGITAKIMAVIAEHTIFDGRDAKVCAAIVSYFDLTKDDLENIEINGHRATIQGTEYFAGTDEEMDEEWDIDLENYLDECVLPELDRNMQKYFNKEAWKKDARQDRRANSLNCYNGQEESVTFNGETYYFYRN